MVWPAGTSMRQKVSEPCAPDTFVIGVPFARTPSVGGGGGGVPPHEAGAVPTLTAAHAHETGFLATAALAAAAADSARARLGRRDPASAGRASA